MNHDGVWTSGFSRIVRYLTSHSLVTDLDAPIRDDPKRAADLIASTALLHSQAAPLLSLSLYVSSANWTATTRPLLSEILPFPLPWTLPPLMRAEAIRRTEYLGLGELDRDFDPNAGGLGSDALPETLRRHLPQVAHRKGVREEMTPEQQAAIRLFAVVDECLLGIQSLLPDDEDGLGRGDSGRFFGEISSFDCLAFGYLSLMRDAPVPRSFLRDSILEKTPRLSAFIDGVRSSCFGTSEKSTALPWASREETRSSLVHFAGRIFDSTFRHMPTLGDYYAVEVRRRAERGAKGMDLRLWGLLAGLLATGLAAGWSLRTYKMLQPFGSRLQIWRRHTVGLGRFGEAGAMLGLGLPGMAAVAAGGAGGNASGPGSSKPSQFVDMDSDEVIGGR